MNNQYAPPQSEVDNTNRSGEHGITSEMIEAMRGTKPWVLLIGIVLVISAALMLLGSLGMIGTAGLAPAEMGGTGMIFGMAAGYALFAVIYIFLAIYLIKYNSAIGRLVQSSAVPDMEEALTVQRKFWKLAGILTLVMVVLSVLGIIAAIAIPFYMGMSV